MPAVQPDLEPLRLFVAADLPENARAALPNPKDPPWRPVAPQSLHVTLAFLGRTDASALPAVVEATRSAAQGLAAPAVTLLQSVALPPRRPRVLAVELDDPDGTLAWIQQRVCDSLAAAGLYSPERRRFLPHVTIGRARAAISREDGYVDVEPLAFTIDTVTVYRSQLSPKGAVYEALERVALGAGR